MTPGFGWRRATGLALALAAAIAGRSGPDAQTAPRLIPPQLSPLVAAARRDLNTFWAARLQNYRPPADVVMVQAPAMTDCGRVDGPNAFYCPPTHKIYWDIGFFSSQYRLGDFAPVFILAHEWAHLVQNQLGLLRTSAGLLDVQQELQADCLAGNYAHDAARRKMLDPGDDDEAVLSLRRAGDGLDSPWFAADAHGTPGQRIDAFSYGFEGRACTDDAFWRFLRERGIDPARVPQTSAPQTGSLQSLMPRQAGRFTLTSARREQLPGATDALFVSYKTPDGIEVRAVVVAFAAIDQARRALDGNVTDLLARGFREVRRVGLFDRATNAETGTLVMLQQSEEVVVWTNRGVLGMTRGPLDVTRELYDALPF